ncbi:MAG: MCE family protein, partial [Cyanobacteria bacterium REEB67]|nr:MCE family protein [Cyanobacteria bacterium REEB67]
MLQKSVEVSENKSKATPTRVSRQMSGDKSKFELRVGLFTMGAVLMATFGNSWLKGFSLFATPPQRFIVQFHDVAGLNNNAPVNINGVRVGVVEKIELSKPGVNYGQPIIQPSAEAAQDAVSKDAAGSKPVSGNEPGLVYVHLKIATEETTIPIGSAITIQTQGMVGAKYIEITLPELAPGQTQPPDIKPDTVVAGQDPVRIELLMNKIATKLNGIVNAAGSEEVGPSLADALKHSGEAVNNINEAAKKLNKNMDRFEKASDTFTSTAHKIGEVADSAKTVTGSANSFFGKGNKTMDSVNTLAVDFQTTSRRLNKILDNPGFSGDLKETARLAKATADSVAVTMEKLNNTIGDPKVRGDVIEMLTKISNSLDKANQSLKTVDKLSEDKDLRAVVNRFSNSLAKLDTVLDSEGLANDTKTTFAKLRVASDNVNLAAEQVQQVLNKPSFGMGLLIGKSGRLKKSKTQATVDGSVSGAAANGSDTAKNTKQASDKARRDLPRDLKDQEDA